MFETTKSLLSISKKNVHPQPKDNQSRICENKISKTMSERTFEKDDRSPNYSCPKLNHTIQKYAILV